MLFSSISSFSRIFKVKTKIRSINMIVWIRKRGRRTDGIGGTFENVARKLLYRTRRRTLFTTLQILFYHSMFSSLSYILISFLCI